MLPAPCCDQGLTSSVGELVGRLGEELGSRRGQVASIAEGLEGKVAEVSSVSHRSINKRDPY